MTSTAAAPLTGFFAAPRQFDLAPIAAAPGFTHALDGVLAVPTGAGLFDGPSPRAGLPIMGLATDMAHLIAPSIPADSGEPPAPTGSTLQAVVQPTVSEGSVEAASLDRPQTMPQVHPKPPLPASIPLPVASGESEPNLAELRTSVALSPASAKLLTPERTGSDTVPMQASDKGRGCDTDFASPSTATTQPLILPPTGIGEVSQGKHPVGKIRAAGASYGTGQTAAEDADDTPRGTIAMPGIVRPAAPATVQIAGPLPADTALPQTDPQKASDKTGHSDPAVQDVGTTAMPVPNPILAAATTIMPIGTASIVQDNPSTAIARPQQVIARAARAASLPASAATTSSDPVAHLKAATTATQPDVHNPVVTTPLTDAPALAAPVAEVPMRGDNPPFPDTATHAKIVDHAEAPAAAQDVRHLPIVSARAGAMGREVGVEIARQTVLGNEQVTLRLDPGTMGKIEVRMHFDDRGSLHAVVAAESPVALELLKRESGDLNRALVDAGVKTDTGSFRFDSRSSGSEAGSGWQRQQNAGHGGHASSRYADASPIAEEPAYYSLRTSGSVDLMA